MVTFVDTHSLLHGVGHLRSGSIVQQADSLCQHAFPPPFILNRTSQCFKGITVSCHVYGVVAFRAPVHVLS